MRLSTCFTLQERRLFSLAMLHDVLGALENSTIEKTVIVASDSEVQECVKDFGMTFLKETRQGLNPALKQATQWCIRRKAEGVLILPADLPLMTPADVDHLVKLGQKNSLVAAPSRNGGTNALLQIPAAIISPSFGVDSFSKHLKAARAKMAETKVYVSSGLMLDMDSEEDLGQLLKRGTQTESYRFLKQRTNNGHN